MKAARAVLALFAVGLLFSACTKTVYETAPVAADTVQTIMVIVDAPDGSACDLYVNGKIYSSMFVNQEPDTMIVPAGSVMEARYMYQNSLYTQTDTALVSDTAGSFDLFASGDTLWWRV